MEVRIIAWEEPTEAVINQIKAEYPGGQLEIIRRVKISGSLYRFMRQQNPDVLYFLYRNIEESGLKNSLLLVLSLLSPAKNRKLIDLNGHVQNSSWFSFLTKLIPSILFGIPYAFSIFLLNVLALKILDHHWIVQLLRVDSPKSSDTKKNLISKRIGFFWSEFPDSNFNFKVGGEISHIVGFFGGLKNLEYDAFMVSARQIVHKQFNAPNEIIDESHLPSWPGEIKKMAYNWKVLLKLRRIFARQYPSLIYHRLSGFSFIGVLISLFYRMPLVVEINTSQAWASNNREGVRFSKTLRLTEHVCTAYAIKIAVVSEEVRNTLVKAGAPENKIIVNPNGVDPDFFTPNGTEKQIAKKYGIKDKIIVGFIGSFAIYHGILTLAKAVPLAVDKISNIHFLIVGDGLLRPEFEEIISSHNLSSYVTLTGKVSHEAAPAILGTCDILVSPTQNMADGTTFIGSPTKVFEYMAMGKGIVATYAGQLAQIFKHEETALLVEPENPQALADAIIRLARDKALRETLGRNAREAVIASYTWEQNAKRILDSLSE